MKEKCNNILGESSVAIFRWLFQKCMFHCQASKLFSRPILSTFVIKIGREEGQG
jgi:hypothetical protein